MNNTSGVSPQIVSLPKGGGEIKGMGEEFSPDLHSGSSKFSIPLKIPSGRNNFQPELVLQYHSTNPNGPYGMGWSIQIPKITRKTTTGVPTYDEKFEKGIISEGTDVFLSDFDDELVNIGSGYFKPKIESNFSKIKTVTASDGEISWEITRRNGMKLKFGSSKKSRVYDQHCEKKIFTWYLDEIQDVFGNRIVYHYARDNGKDIQKNLDFFPEESNHAYNQTYIDYIEYLDYQDKIAAKEKFLWKIEFDYGQLDHDSKLIKNWEKREDVFSNYRSGFEIRTARICKRILVKKKLIEDEDYHLIKSYELFYTPDPYSKISVLTKFQLTWISKEGGSDTLPPMMFDYTKFIPSNKKEYLNGDLPPTKLGKDTELLDIFSNGLPSIVYSGFSKWDCWKNTGKLTFTRGKMNNNTGTAGTRLSSKGIRFADMNGDGSVELLMGFQQQDKGYFRKDSDSGDWEKFIPYDGPDINLEDFGVHLIDLSGDGISDILIQNGQKLSYWKNKGNFDSLEFAKMPLDSEYFPDVDLGNPYLDTRFSDLSGDGLQDVVDISLKGTSELEIFYWPNLGNGKFGSRIKMQNSPKLPVNYEKERLFFIDSTGDGLSDIVYVDFNRIYFWINQNGNSFSDVIVIDDIPESSDPTSIRIVDMNGTGTTGILWSYLPHPQQKSNYVYLDLTSGVKPHLLNFVDNSLGKKISIDYKPSTYYYLDDLTKNPWKTVQPFPFQVVSRVQQLDEITQNILVNEFRYSHGYWDGVDRMFHGFGKVDVFESQKVQDFSVSETLKPFITGQTQFHHSPPTRKTIWFHQGSVGDPYKTWKETDFSDEFWGGDANKLSRPKKMAEFLESLPEDVRRNAVKTLRAKPIREEKYILDGTDLEKIPYHVKEYQYGIIPFTSFEEWLSHHDLWEEKAFIPIALSERYAVWERGNEPLTKFKFFDDYDKYGQHRIEINLAVPRGVDYSSYTENSKPYLGIMTKNEFAYRDDDEIYIVDKMCSSTKFEIINDGTDSVFDLVRKITESTNKRSSLKLVGHTLNYFDGEPFEGLSYGQMGSFGAVSKTEILTITEKIINDAFQNTNSRIPPYFDNQNFSNEYPDEFKEHVGRGGYHFKTKHDGYQYYDGYYAITKRSKYDFQNNENSRGNVRSQKDSLDNEIKMDYDDYGLYVKIIKHPNNLTVNYQYDYNYQKVKKIQDFNDNVTRFNFNSFGFLSEIWKNGQDGENVGDVKHPSVSFVYDFNSKPISVTTTKFHFHDSDDNYDENKFSITREFTDGFERTIQSRSITELDLLDDDKIGSININASYQKISCFSSDSKNIPVVVSSWKVYDNFNRIVEEYEPFFSHGLEFQYEKESKIGQKIITKYDSEHRVIEKQYPDKSKKLIIYGKPKDLATPRDFVPNPWDKFIYDQNDNDDSSVPDSAYYEPHRHTPKSVELDALGREIKYVERNGSDPESWIETSHFYDVRNNLIKIINHEGIPVVANYYDLFSTGNKITQKLQDSGTIYFIFNTEKKLIEKRDSKGSIQLNQYDRLNRKIKLWARDNPSETVSLREYFIYGDDEHSKLNETKAKKLNLLGKPYKIFDEAGYVEFIPVDDTSNSKPYDFNGNVLEKVRYVFNDNVVLHVFDQINENWKIPQFHPCWNIQKIQESKTLVGEGFRISNTFDALNRLTSVVTPENVENNRNKIEIFYNVRNLVSAIKYDQKYFIKKVFYNAKNKKTLVEYGNNISSRFEFDNLSFRLKRHICQQYSDSNEIINFSNKKILDLEYGYDLVGNVTTILDNSPKCGIKDTRLGMNSFERKFVYDPSYRLITATGREHDSEHNYKKNYWNNSQYNSDETKTRMYNEEYKIDKSNNISSIKHYSGNKNFLRVFSFRDGSNKIKNVTIGDSIIDYNYDSNGNLISETSLRHFEWDYNDRLKTFATQKKSSEPSIYAIYLYDSDGNRVKKIVRKQNGNHFESTTYLVGIFEYYKKTSGRKTHENNLVKISMGNALLAQIRIGVPFPDDKTKDIKFFISDHINNTAIALDSSGNITNREEFTPFGETSFGGYSRKRYRFFGKEYDEESGLYYFGARYYVSFLARWINLDPELFVDGYNLYAFSKNNPVSLFDKAGTSTIGIQELENPQSEPTRGEQEAGKSFEAGQSIDNGTNSNQEDVGTQYNTDDQNFESKNNPSNSSKDVSPNNKPDSTRQAQDSDSNTREVMWEGQDRWGRSKAMTGTKEDYGNYKQAQEINQWKTRGQDLKYFGANVGDQVGDAISDDPRVRDLMRGIGKAAGGMAGAAGGGKKQQNNANNAATPPRHHKPPQQYK